MNVLVVEDDPNLGMLWSKVLSDAGHVVLLVESEAAALMQLQSNPYDLVLLDLCINGRNALGVATLATYRNPACKVVIASGSAEFSRRALFAMSPAVAAALRKPVDIEDLMEVCELVARNDRPAPVPAIDRTCIEFRP